MWNLSHIKSVKLSVSGYNLTNDGRPNGKCSSHGRWTCHWCLFGCLLTQLPSQVPGLLRCSRSPCSDPTDVASHESTHINPIMNKPRLKKRKQNSLWCPLWCPVVLCLVSVRPTWKRIRVVSDQLTSYKKCRLSWVGSSLIELSPPLGY